VPIENPGSLNLLEPSGPVQASIGIALYFSKTYAHALTIVVYRMPQNYRFSV
jgi:hypothetical protein